MCPEPFALLPTKPNYAVTTVLLTLAVGSRTVDELYEQTGIPKPRLTALLAVLARRGTIIERKPGRYFARRLGGHVVRP